MRKAAAQAMQDALTRRAEESLDGTRDEQRFEDARAKEKRMGALISSLTALAHASGVAQERALFMEVANREVENQMKKLRGGEALARSARAVQPCSSDCTFGGRLLLYLVVSRKL